MVTEGKAAIARSRERVSVTSAWLGALMLP